MKFHPSLVAQSNAGGLSVQTSARTLSRKDDQMATRRKKISTKIIALRNKIWPDLEDSELWDRHKYDGFTSIPRTLPIIMNIIDNLTKSKPAAKTYLTLWGQAYDEMYISLKNQEDLAFQSGLTGQRAVRTWKERMESLAALGFIKIAAGPRGTFSHAVVLNPHFVIRRLHAAGEAGLTEAAFNTLVERANDITAKDMEEDLPEDIKALDDDIPF